MKNPFRMLSAYFMRKRVNASIKDKVKYTTIGLCLAILAVFLLVSYFYTKKKILELSVNNYQEILSKQFELIQYMAERNVETVERIAGRTGVAAAADRSEASEELRTYFREVMAESGEYDKILLINAAGAVVYSTDKGDRLDKGYARFNEIEGSDDIVIGEAVMVKYGKKEHYSQPVSLPVYRGGGIAGYVIAFINMNILDDQLSTMDLGEKGNAFIVDHSGRVLCSSGDFEHRKNIYAFHDYTVSNMTGSLKGYRLVNPRTGGLIDSIKTSLETDHAGIAMYENNNERNVVGLWKWFSYFRWVFLIEVDRAEVFAPVTTTLTFYMIIGAVFIAGTYFIASYLSRSINKPIAGFIESFSRGASGNISVRFPLPDISGKSIMRFEDGQYTAYDKSKGLCFFEIGTFAEYLGKEVACRNLCEGMLNSCEQCRIYMLIMHNEIGQIGAWYNMFMKNLQSVIQNIKTMIDVQRNSSADMKHTTEQFSDNAHQQASSAEEIMATIEELFAGFDSVVEGTIEQYNSLMVMIHRVVELSGIIDEIGGEIKKTQMGARDIAGMAEAGGNKLTEMTSIMNTINDSSHQMTGIINIINDISEQINLLSLNASIEAARAGDYGRGFAVVAEEISKLADLTAKSVKEIDSLIKSNTDEISKGMPTVTESVNTLKSIIDGFNAISEMMTNINNYMQRQSETNMAIHEEMNEVKSKSEEIKKSTEEQKIASDDIIKSIGLINELTQESAQGADDIARNADELSRLASELGKNVDFFKV